MIFNSIDFLIFIFVVWLVFRQLERQLAKRIWILTASLFFYGWWHWEYLILIFLTSTIDFGVAIAIGNSTDQQKKGALLLVSIFSNLLILSYFKYGLFVGTSLENLGIIHEIPDWLEVILPVGISFYTFQAMAYVIDVYKNRVDPEKSFPQFLLFISFFPQLVAGPIERAPHLMAQLKKLKVISGDKMVNAILLIVWGFWKKLFLADRLGVFVDGVFEIPEQSNGYQILLGTVFFGFQIYCDFSAYSDIARGVGRFFGVDLMLNFDRPYLSTNLADFWRRWHISLSGWFRDYVYIPLGGNRLGEFRTISNVLFVFALSGLWHGANWTFILWGFWHGTGLVAERIIAQKPSKFILSKPITYFWIFSGWLIFRANSVSDIGILTKNLGQFPAFDYHQFNVFNSNSELILAFLGIVILMKAELHQEKWLTIFQKNLSLSKQLIGLTISIILLVWFGHFKGQDFIYFQF